MWFMKEKGGVGRAVVGWGRGGGGVGEGGGGDRQVIYDNGRGEVFKLLP